MSQYACIKWLGFPPGGVFFFARVSVSLSVLAYVTSGKWQAKCAAGPQVRERSKLWAAETEKTDPEPLRSTDVIPTGDSETDDLCGRDK